MSLMQDQPKVTSAPAEAEPSPPLEYQTRERANAQLRAFKLPRMQELGLLVVIFVLGAILSIFMIVTAIGYLGAVEEQMLAPTPAAQRAARPAHVR